jgi:prephenate dehydratase
MKIAFLGPHASFTQLAAAQLFPDDELMPQASILDCFNAVESGEALKGCCSFGKFYRRNSFHDAGLFI